MGDLYQHPQDQSWSADCPCGWSITGATAEDARLRLAIHERDGSRGEVARLQDERDALRLAGYVIVEHLDHWCECPLPPDANCDPCRLFSRALAAFNPSPAASGPKGDDRG